MIVEVDQSGKVEQLNTDTVVAYADDKVSSAIFIKAGTKQKIIRYLRTTLLPQNELYPIFFAILVFILTRTLKSDTSIKIDEEYTGKESVIKETIEKLVKKRTKAKQLRTIKFGQIGKQSPAHNLAWKVHRMKQKKGFLKIGEDDVLKYLK